ncbi:MAG: DNA-processing protein DprA [Lachnospiraceae bacterium]|nr:DNA-processing protein DprA [Lachnospiraceae bacterium]
MKRKLQEQGIRMIPYFSEEYPKKLTNISQPPYALYVKGSLPRENQVSVAIVGARRCTHYGEQIALEYGEALASEGIQIISGMARGIDGAGQRGALNAGGATYGVLGCGVDICYPRENIGLYMDIQQKGGIISEQIPGQPPLPAYFPERNRIISGLADVVLVIEAKEKSGSLITADMALEQGKDVYALPGPVTSSMSQGCHRLIRQGAGILISPEDLLIELGINIVNQGQIIDKNEKVLESTENMVYSCLGLFPKGMSQLLEETGLNVQELLEQLITLEMKGYVKEISKNYYVKLR